MLLQHQRGHHDGHSGNARFESTSAHDDFEEPDRDTEQISKRAEKFNSFQGSKGATSLSTSDRGLPPGTYRVSSMNSAANHQPVHMPVAPHESRGGNARVSIAFSLPSVILLAETSELSSTPTDGFPRGQKSSSSPRGRRRMEQ